MIYLLKVIGLTPGGSRTETPCGTSTLTPGGSSKETPTSSSTVTSNGSINEHPVVIVVVVVE
jgi:hypothetical protein